MRHSQTPPLSLEQLLRRRKKARELNLAGFLREWGIATYDLLLIKCDRMGVAPPALHVFETALGDGKSSVSSPAEGVVVCEALDDDAAGDDKKPSEKRASGGKKQPRRDALINLSSGSADTKPDVLHPTGDHTKQ